jgi:hypothetical protein
MQPNRKVQDVWRIEQSTAQWNSARLHATIELTRPAEGIQCLSFTRASLKGMQLMRVAVPKGAHGLPKCVEDAYVRGPDIIVTYAETPQSPVRPQVYWRILDEPLVSPGVVLEAIVSIQTRLLDSDPRIELASTLPGRDWLCLAGDAATGGFRPVALDDRSPRSIDIVPSGTALLGRIPVSSCSYGHILLATDLLDAHIAWDPAHRMTTLSAVFFGERLEKGILRRVRSRAILVPREQDEELMAELLITSVAAAPPLAT